MSQEERTEELAISTYVNKFRYTFENTGVFDLGDFAFICYLDAMKKGYWDNQYEDIAKEVLNADLDPGVKNRVLGALTDAGARNVGEMLALEHLGLSERLEAIKGADSPLMSDNIPGFTLEEEIVADTLLRLLNYCRGRTLRLTDAAVAKMLYSVGKSS